MYIYIYTQNICNSNLAYSLASRTNLSRTNHATNTITKLMLGVSHSAAVIQALLAG